MESKLSKPKYKSVAVLNHVNSLNLGDASLIYMIIKILRQSISTEKIFVFTFDLAKDADIIKIINDEGVEFLSSPARLSKGDRANLLLQMMSYLVWALIYRITGKDLSDRFANKSICLALKDAELVVIEGGDSLADSYGYFSLITHAYNIALALLLKKKTIILGNTIGPLKKTISKRMLFFLLRHIDKIVVRDMQSVSVLHQAGVNAERIHFIPDVAFDLPTDQGPKESVPLKDSQQYVGIVPSALISQLIGADGYAEFMARLCDNMSEKYGVRIVFVPHVLSEGNNDRNIAHQIAGKMRNKNTITIDYETNPMRVKYIISKLALLISPRMHPVIHALSSGVPVIAIDYNNKTREVMKLVDKEEWVLDLKDLDRLESLVALFFDRQKSSYKIQKISITDKYVQFLKQLD